MNVLDRAREDAKKITANTDESGSPYTLIAPDNTEYPVVGLVGDIGLLVVPETGEKVQSRSIASTAIIDDLNGAEPVRGWRARLTDKGKTLEVFVATCAPDRTLGIYNLTLSLNLGAADD
jgi:hypothetical protein